jgi:hypothetical protein
VLARRRAHLERARIRRLAGEAHAPLDPDVDAVLERVADFLRPEAVGSNLREALDLYLDAASREADAELDERSRRAGEPPESFEGALEGAVDPADRARILRHWESLERSLESVRLARAEQREAAARAAGGSSVADLRGRALGVELRGLLEEAERRAIAPLDEAVARAAGSPLEAPPPDVAALRRLGVALGEDPDGRGARLLRGGPACWRTVAACPPGERGCVILGSRGGIDAWGAFGAATRAGVVSRARGARTLAAEHPAWARAAEALFRRLPLDPGFRAFAGMGERDGLDAALRLDAAVRPRVAWALASAALEPDPPSEAPERFRRATGAAPLPAIRAGAWDRDPAEAAAWLGEIWALLLEERLRTRWGRGWYVQAAAASWLRDVWIAEPDAEPDAMAAQAAVGTMTPDAVLEACRPPRRVS